MKNYVDSILEDVIDHALDREFSIGAMLPQCGNYNPSPEEINTEYILKMIASDNGGYATVESFEDVDNVTDSLYEDLFLEASEKTPIEMRSIVDKLNSKGYKVKYASPGHLNTKFKNDKNGDRISYQKLVSTARVIFKDSEIKIEAPYLWELKILDGCTGLYVKPYTYNEKSQGSKEEAFKHWREMYLQSLDEWASKTDNINGQNEKKSTNKTLDKLKLKFKD